MLIFIINVLTVLFFVGLCFQEQKARLLALVFAGVFLALGIWQNLSVNVLCLGFAGNFVISLIVFALMRRFQETFVSFIFVIGGIALLFYVSSLPFFHLMSQPLQIISKIVHW